MIESTYQARTATHQTYKSIQAWKKPQAVPAQYASQSAKNNIIHNLDKASKGQIGRYDVELNKAYAYADSGQRIARNKDNEFRFGDVVDIVNPLHHIPLVSMVYRGITNDQLHPMSGIIGGALYGGPVGVVTGTANAISKVQTGKDMGEHALEFVGFKNKPIIPNDRAILEPTIMSGFAPTTDNVQAVKAYEDTAATHHSFKDLNLLPERDKMTTLSLSPMPVRQEI
jgi:hypothetical protein